jgi:hypothetical protein
VAKLAASFPLGGCGSGADSEKQRWSSNLGGAGRDDSPVGDGSSVRRHVGFFAEQRGREKGRAVARPRWRWVVIGRRGLNRGGNGGPKIGPWGYSAGQR